MTEITFSVIVSEFDLDNEIQNAMIETLPYEVIVGSSNGIVSLEVTIEQASTQLNVLSKVLSDIAAIEAVPVRFDLDLVGVTEIAERLNASREAVRLWTNGERLANFPTPHDVIGSSKVWAWVTVYEWAQLNNKPIDELYGTRPVDLNTVELLNGRLARDRIMNASGWQFASALQIQRGRSYAKGPAARANWSRAS